MVHRRISWIASIKLLWLAFAGTLHLLTHFTASLHHMYTIFIVYIINPIFMWGNYYRPIDGKSVNLKSSALFNSGIEYGLLVRMLSCMRRFWISTLYWNVFSGCDYKTKVLYCIICQALSTNLVDSSGRLHVPDSWFHQLSRFHHPHLQ
jgi:hypothetical protein